MLVGSRLAALGLLASFCSAALPPAIRAINNDPLANCPGYKATNVKTSVNGLTAELKLAGKACNAYGTDLDNLVLEVTYETGELADISIKELEW